MIQRSSIAELAGYTLKGPDGPLPGAFLADSRLVCPGDAFVAFRGAILDGHLFIKDAIARGATLIICEDDKDIPEDTASILVKNTYEALPEMARKRLLLEKKIEVIAVTGSVGKTTTREMLVRCLAGSFAVHSARHSYNTLIGCSMSILSLPEKMDILLLEMGTNHPGEIREIVRFFPPTVAIITEVASAHLEGLSSIEGVLAAKLEIMESSKVHSVFFNGDNALLLKNCMALSPIHSFSVGFGKNDFQIQNSDFHVDQGIPSLSFDFKYPGGSFPVSTRLFGKHAAYPLAFALAVSFSLDISKEKLLVEIKKIEPLAGRGKMITLSSGCLLLDDSYNANPTSMMASLREFLTIPAARRFAIIGEMLELGDAEEAYHRNLIPFFEGFEKVWLVGKTWKRVVTDSKYGKNLFHCADVSLLQRDFFMELGDGDTLLVKGSHGNRLDKIVSDLYKEAVS